MKVPFVDLQRQYQALRESIDSAVQDVMARSSFIQGPELGEFERRFAASLGMEHAVGVASGTDALLLAARALELRPGDEVIVPVNTWISTAFAVSLVGATPVLVDVDASTHQMDVASLRAAVSKSTKAVFAVHMYGHSAPMTEIKAFCWEKGLRLVEDVAQSPYALVGDQLVGSFGDIACYSFYPSKNLGCYGDGGAVVSNDPEMVERVRRLALYGQSEKYRHETIGYNSRLDSLQAAILLEKLPYVVQWTKARQENADKYTAALKGLPVDVIHPAPGTRSVYHLYVVEVENRDACLEFLQARSIMAQIHYPNLIHQQECYVGLNHRPGDFPVAERAAKKILSLPMYPELSDEQITYVRDTLEEFFNT